MQSSDIELAVRYANKAEMAKGKHLDFTISFAEYKRLHSLKRCAYSGLEFCGYTDNKPDNLFTCRTLDRIDASKGYVPGNVVAVCQGVNNLKSVWENPNNPLTCEMVAKIIKSVLAVGGH